MGIFDLLKKKKEQLSMEKINKDYKLLQKKNIEIEKEWLEEENKILLIVEERLKEV